MTEQELKAIDAEVREIVNVAADFAQHDPEPDSPSSTPTFTAEARKLSSRCLHCRLPLWRTATSPDGRIELA